MCCVSLCSLLVKTIFPVCISVCVSVCKCGTHGLQPAVVELVGCDIRPWSDNAVLGTGHEAAGDAHLSGDLVWTLLDLRLQQDRLTQRNR